MSPELITQIAQLGIGTVALVVTLQLRTRVDRLVRGHDRQEGRISRLERHAGIEPTPPINHLEPYRG